MVIVQANFILGLQQERYGLSSSYQVPVWILWSQIRRLSCALMATADSKHAALSACVSAL